jgi:hypothetical protein
VSGPLAVGGLTRRPAIWFCRRIFGQPFFVADLTLAQALVARGVLKRRLTSSASVYTDENDNVLLRCCPFESFIDSLDALLDLESHGPRTLLLSPL